VVATAPESPAAAAGCPDSGCLQAKRIKIANKKERMTFLEIGKDMNKNLGEKEYHPQA
jgi:hypothetical protein